MKSINQSLATLAAVSAFAFASPSFAAGESKMSDAQLDQVVAGTYHGNTGGGQWGHKQGGWGHKQGGDTKITSIGNVTDVLNGNLSGNRVNVLNGLRVLNGNALLSGNSVLNGSFNSIRK